MVAVALDGEGGSLQLNLNVTRRALVDIIATHTLLMGDRGLAPYTDRPPTLIQKTVYGKARKGP